MPYKIVYDIITLPFLNLYFRLLVFVHDEFSVFDFDDPITSHTVVPTCQSKCRLYKMDNYNKSGQFTLMRKRIFVVGLNRLGCKNSRVVKFIHTHTHTQSSSLQNNGWERVSY